MAHPVIETALFLMADSSSFSNCIFNDGKKRIFDVSVLPELRNTVHLVNVGGVHWTLIHVDVSNLTFELYDPADEGSSSADVMFLRFKSLVGTVLQPSGIEE